MLVNVKRRKEINNFALVYIYKEEVNILLI